MQYERYERGVSKKKICETNPESKKKFTKIDQPRKNPKFKSFLQTNLENESVELKKTT